MGSLSQASHTKPSSKMYKFMVFLTILMFGYQVYAQSGSCCQKKVVDGVVYNFKEEKATGQYSCLNGCVYTTANNPGREFCFKAGDKSVSCMENGKPDSRDWTCGHCAAAGKTLGRYAANLTHLYNLSAEIHCPNAPDENFCDNNLNWMWTHLMPTIIGTHFLYICDDRQDCKPQRNNHGVAPSCAACEARIKGILSALAWDSTIKGWKDGLDNCSIALPVPILNAFPDHCDNAKDMDLEKCDEFVDFLLPVGLPWLVEQEQKWVTEFCKGWGCSD